MQRQVYYTTSLLYVCVGLRPFTNYYTNCLATIGGQYRGTFLVPVPSILWGKSTGTAVPVPQCRYFYFSIFGGTRYFCKIFSNKKIIMKKVKSAQLHLHSVHLPQQSLERFVFMIQYCHPVKRGNRKILFQQKKMF